MARARVGCSSRDRHDARCAADRARSCRHSGEIPRVGLTLAPVEAERAEWRAESWVRRTRFTAVVTLVALSIALAVLVPGVGAWLSGALMVVAAVWHWLPMVLRCGRKFVEGYQSA